MEKYIVKSTESTVIKQGKKPKVSRLIEGQIHLHIDTENLRKNAFKIKPDDLISVTYKTHGTSWWVSNVLVKKNLTWLEKVLKRRLKKNKYIPRIRFDGDESEVFEINENILNIINEEISSVSWN